MTTPILVTGGAGYIGSHCCQRLAAAGFLPVVYDDLSTGHRDFVRWGPLIKADVRDRAALAAAFTEHRPALVLHFAALALVGESVAHPERYWDINVGGTLALLEAMRGAGCERLVFSSSCAVYGEPEGVPITEAAPTAPVNPYGASKLAAEWIMDGFGRAHGLRSVRLRYFNAAGADPAGGIGEDHDPETHLVPLALDAAMGRRPALAVFGNDYPTPDGTAIRDYVHVVDIAEAHLAAARRLLGGGASLAVNLGTGQGASAAPSRPDPPLAGPATLRVWSPTRREPPTYWFGSPSARISTMPSRMPGPGTGNGSRSRREAGDHGLRQPPAQAVLLDAAALFADVR